MIIQCPECKARYRTSVLSADQLPLKVNCPKCNKQFILSSEAPVVTEELTETQPTILFVDDARFFRQLLVDLLKDSNAHLLSADNAEEAWLLLHGNSVNLLIVDLNLPDKNGLDLIREIREEGSFDKLRILAISGVYRKEDDAMMAIRAGADDFISKSFKPYELSERIDKLLNK